MYVTCWTTNEVVIFDLTKDSIIGRVTTLYTPYGAALTPDGSELWTAAYGSNKIHIISTATNQVIAEIDSVSSFPVAITFTPDDASYAYVACELSTGGAHHHATGGVAPSSYVVIDRKTRKILSLQELPGTSTNIITGYK
jgi:YVTN family beta-propeller protein